jgi:superfamily II DNA or RNA helicase
MNLLVDRHVFALTMRTLGTYRRLLVVYGSAHLITQWRALSAALGRPRLS